GRTPHLQVIVSIARHKRFLGGVMAEHQRELEVHCMTSFPGSCVPTNDFAEASAHQKVAARRVAQLPKILYRDKLRHRPRREVDHIHTFGFWITADERQELPVGGEGKRRKKLRVRTKIVLILSL